MDVVIIRENEERPLHRHRIPPEYARYDGESKLISRSGGEKSGALRLRVRQQSQSYESNLLHKRQYHEVDRWPLPQRF